MSFHTTYIFKAKKKLWMKSNPLVPKFLRRPCHNLSTRQVTIVKNHRTGLKLVTETKDYHSGGKVAVTLLKTRQLILFLWQNGGRLL